MQNPASSGGCLPSSAAPVISSALEGVPAQAVASWLQAPWEPRTADFADNTVGTRPGAGAGTTVLSLAELPLLGWWASGQRGCWNESGHGWGLLSLLPPPTPTHQAQAPHSAPSF